MGDVQFKLPKSSFGEITKLLIAFAKSKSTATLDDLNKLTGINKTIISSNNGFLESIGAIQGGKSKEATEIGRQLGLAIANQIDSEVKNKLQELFSVNEFIMSMLTALEIKPRSVEDFQSHIAYSVGKELKGRIKTGTGTVIEMLQISEMIEEKEGLLYTKSVEISSTEQANSSKENSNQSNVEENNSPNSSGEIPSKQFINDLGQNVTLNINIQLTIPDTDDEKVYENFFKAMKKNLLS